MKMKKIRSYSELIRIPSYEERFEYLRLSSIIGESTFGFDRWINQELYRSKRWRNDIRDRVIIRDNGCDMAHSDYPIVSGILIHHINPITIEDVENMTDAIFDLDNLVCVSHRTHNAIHYGDRSLLQSTPVVRKPGDTCPWK